MSVVLSVPALYRPGRVHLWVEDPVTREYLAVCWNDADFAFHVAGGNHGVQAIVKDAEDQGLGYVFGFVDQDFGRSNRAEWLNRAKTFRRFVSGVHEVENYLLDADALAGCSLNVLGRTAAEVLERIKQRANELLWWMACRRVIKDIYLEFCDGFVGHPACEMVMDFASAKSFIVSHQWFVQLRGRADSLLAPGEIDNRLTTAHAKVGNELETEAWRDTFSGKELFHHVRDYVYSNHPDRNARATDLDTDVARSVAAWQVEHARVPTEVADLRKALRQRVGI